MSSHIGFESAVGSDCWNLTRSILAENSPYYETGIKLNFTNKKEDLYVALLILNGWQKIDVPNWNQIPSIGIQINYKPTNALTLNYSNFIGRIELDSTDALRIFHNLYATYEASPKISFIIGFDLGTQQDKYKNLKLWYTPILISKIHLNRLSKIAGRLEYYKDKEQVIIKTGTPNGYQTLGASLNYDYQVSKNVWWRAELKKYFSKDPIYTYEQRSSSNSSATVAVIVKL